MSANDGAYYIVKARARPWLRDGDGSDRDDVFRQHHGHNSLLMQQASFAVNM